MNRENHKSNKFSSALKLCALALVLSAGLSACHSDDMTGSYVADSKLDGLPDIKLTDQKGQTVSLASLKGKPVLVDFIYTTCQGPCPILTSKLALIANLMPYELGHKVTMVSVTVDPEHDHPKELMDYARSHRADRNGWLFLTGTPEQIEQVLAAYNMRRRHESDGSVTHMTTVFLLGPDGHQKRIYNGVDAKPAVVTADILRSLEG